MSTEEQANLNLDHASTDSIGDDPKSWPQQGNRYLNGFVYRRIGSGPTDAKSRLRWLHLQNVFEPSWFRRVVHGILYGGQDLHWQQLHWPKFTPQPYQQLAKVLREDGDISGSKRVLIDMENSRRKYGNLRFTAWLWSWILRGTIGYGYRPWYALLWSLSVVFLGSILFARGYCLGIVTPTDKEAFDVFNLRGEPPVYYQTFSALVYSLDNFLPIISLGEKDHWAPNADLGAHPMPRFAWLTQGWLLRVYLLDSRSYWLAAHHFFRSWSNSNSPQYVIMRNGEG